MREKKGRELTGTIFQNSTGSIDLGSVDEKRAGGAEDCRSVVKRTRISEKSRRDEKKCEGRTVKVVVGEEGFPTRRDRAGNKEEDH